MKDTSRKDAGIHGLKSEDMERNGVKSVDVEGDGAKSVNMERNNTKLDEAERNREKLKDNGVKGAGRVDTKIKKIQRENIQSKNTRK